MANCGTYIFSNGLDFRMHAEALLESPEAAEGGLYASSLMSLMISKGEDFYGIKVNCEDVALVSTPAQLEDFTRRVSNGQVLAMRRMRFCFDLDGTLVGPKDGSSDSEPVPGAIELVRQLSRAGHTIILTTSRGMMPGGGVDRAIAQQGQDTFELLKSLDIPYDESLEAKSQSSTYVLNQVINKKMESLQHSTQVALWEAPRGHHGGSSCNQLAGQSVARVGLVFGRVE